MPQILLKLWLPGYWTSYCPIRSVIILVTKQIGLPLRCRLILLTTRMITDLIGLHSVPLPLLIIIIICAKKWRSMWLTHIEAHLDCLFVGEVKYFLEKAPHKEIR